MHFEMIFLGPSFFFMSVLGIVLVLGMVMRIVAVVS